MIFVDDMTHVISMATSGTDWLEEPTMQLDYISPQFQGIMVQNMARILVQYLRLGILMGKEWPLMGFLSWPLPMAQIKAAWIMGLNGISCEAGMNLKNYFPRNMACELIWIFFMGNMGK